VVGNPPAWGPKGYTEVRYYYIPDVHAYYDVSSSRFIYYENNRWTRSADLPAQYRSYDLYNGYKQPLHGYKGNSPYIFYPAYKIKYKPNYRAGQQVTISPRPNPVVILPNGFPNGPKVKLNDGNSGSKGNQGRYPGGNGNNGEGKGGNGQGKGNSGGGNNGGGKGHGGKGK
jgi:hypothetical protein